MTVDALAASKLFAGLDDGALKRLADSGDEVEVGPGYTLMEEGSAPDAMYVLIEGEMDVRRRIGGEEVSIGTVHPGELVGELSLLHGRPRSAHVCAAAPSRLLRIPADALDELLSHPGAARELLATATRRLEQQELLVLQHGRMAALGTLTAGLLHELNNPAAAVRRAVDHIATAVEGVAEAERRLAHHAASDVRERLAALIDLDAPRLDPLARADAEDVWRDWADTHGRSRGWELSGALAAAGIVPSQVEEAVGDRPPDVVFDAAAWVAATRTLRRLLGEARTGATRVAEIVAAVKSFSHHDEAPVGDVDVHAGIESALTLLAHKIHDGVEVVRRFDEQVGTIEGYPGDLNVVWTNLIDNALDAIGHRGTLVIATRRRQDDIEVTITDDGTGIPADVLARIFDPFFTTKPVGKGTGLGLATTHAIVTRGHHGEIAIDSEPGSTVATVRLPAHASDSPAGSPPRDLGSSDVGAGGR